MNAREGAGGVIRAPVADARREAERILRDARAEAARIERAAVADIERARREGWAAGRGEAFARHTEETIRALARLDAWVDALQERLAALGRTCAERILERELTLRPDAVLDVVRSATRDVRWATDIRIRAHPDDVETIQVRLNRLASELSPSAVVRVSSDPEIRRGGCTVTTELGTVDATLDTQLGAIEAALAAAESDPRGRG